MIDWFYSDPHFGHAKIIEYEHRIFPDVEMMNLNMLALYNQRVQPGQVCLFMGDVFLMPFEAAREIMEQLNGTKLLLMGNHDKSAKWMAELGFIVLEGEVILSIAGRKVRVSHYPYWTGPEDRHGRGRWLTEGQVEEAKKRHPVRRPGEVLLHGHIHGRTRRRDNAINLSADAWGYAPVSWGQVENLVRKV